MTYLQPAVHLHVRTACSIFHPFPSNPRRNIVDNHPTEISSRSLSLFFPSPFFLLSRSRCYVSALPIAAPSLSVQQACAGAGARDGQPTAAPPRRGGWGRSRCPPARGSGLGRVGHRRSRRPGLRHGTPVGARSAWCALYPLPLALSLPSSPSLSRSPSLALARWLRVRRLSSIAGVRARPFGAGAAAPEGRASTAAPPSPYQRSIC